MAGQVPRVQADAAVISGGMDLVVSPIFAKPGAAYVAYNYEYSVQGGVDRVGGIEPYDGRPSPSAAGYTLLVFSASRDGIINIGDTVVGVTSTATGKVIYVSGKNVAVTKVTLAFLNTENITVSSVPVGTLVDSAGEVDGFLDNTLHKAAADVYQADIGRPPGTGPIYGLCLLNDVLYCWRNTALAVNLRMYKATSSGWTLVTTPTLDPITDTKVRTRVYSFTSSVNGKIMYGCDGVNPEFSFDGTTYTQLSTGMGSVRATAVNIHKNHLFFAYRGSLQHSSIGAPTSWSAVTGAGELATGDIITDLTSFGGQSDSAAMMVSCKNALYVLYGTSVLNWQLVPLSHVSGASAGSVQDIGGIVAVDTPGVVRYPATRAFGNFAWDTVSMQIQPAVRNQKVSCSVYASGVFKYRVFFTDGTAISGLPIENGQFAWSLLNYGRTITCAEHAELSGNARTWYGDANGWVYEADKGRSFAGEPIQYVIKLHPLTQRSPMVEKGYKQMQLEIQSQSACTIYTSADFNDGDGGTQTTETPQYGPGLTYDLANYDESFWDVAAVSRRTMPLDGAGTSVAITIAGESNLELTHTLYAVTVLYSPRRITR